jgi:glycosyltransferase involved in cell wall biosynthesis
MRIGINSRIYQNANTGIPNFIKNLYSTIQTIDKKDNFIFFQSQKDKKLGDTKITKTFNNSIGSVLFDLFFVNKLIKSEKINVYHGPSHILPFFKVKNVKYVVTIHDLSFLIFPNSNPKLFYLYYKIIVKLSLNKSDSIIADSENTKNDIIKFYNISPEKIKVIYPGLNKEFLHTNDLKRIIKEKYFFSLSTHIRRKNITSIIHIISHNKNLQKYKYVIAGLIPQNQLKELKELISNHNLKNNVILFGYAKDEELVNLYKHAEFFIYPSFYEGFGFPVIESMACRCPVIASNNSSIPEISSTREWLINPYDEANIEKTIEKMISLTPNEKKELIEENFKFAIKFNWDDTAKKYLTVFNNLHL